MVESIRHKSVSCIYLMVFVLFSCNGASLISNNKELITPPAKKEYVKDEVIVRFKDTVTEERIKEISTSLSCVIIRKIGPTKTFLIKIKTGGDVKEIIDKYKQFEEVEHAQPNYIKYMQ